jgi:hypothetical protein
MDARTVLNDAGSFLTRVEFSFAHMWMGRFPRQVLGTDFRGDRSYFYTTITTSFGSESKRILDLRRKLGFVETEAGAAFQIVFDPPAAKNEE